MPQVFSRNGDFREREQEELIDELYRQIGQLKVELDWLKKNLRGSVEERRGWIKPDHPEISVSWQCALVGLTRAS